MDILYFVPTWQIALAFFASLIAAVECGHLFGRRGSDRSGEGGHGTFLSVTGAVVGLLSLLLAFSFSMAASRYDLRKHLLVKEANAIGTSYLRASLLRDEATSRMRDLLRQYVDARLAQQDAVLDPTAIQQTAAATEHLQARLWDVVTAEARADSHSVSAAQVVQSVNEVIDVSAEQAAAYRNHIPEIILCMLLATALISAVVVGCAFGKSWERHRAAAVLFAAMVTVVVVALFDLDRPRRGLIQISQQAMTDFRASIQPGS